MSPLQAEYIGLVMTLRALILVYSLVICMLDFLKQPMDSCPTIHYTLFENNQGAYIMVINQHVSTRTKYFCVKYHFFWPYVYHPKNYPGS